MRDDPPRASTLPAGYDEDDPYGDDDLSSYPAWWRENVELFRSHGMRPYRPSRFADGTVVPTAIERLESAFGVEISIRTVETETGAEWAIVVDGEPVAHVEHERTTRGVTQYQIAAESVERLVRDAVE